jgi:pimeloyl-ACP methyl ester carboxylesterase
VKRPLSQLIYAPVQEGVGSPRTITLHKHNQHARDVSDYGLAASPAGRVIGLESYKGVFAGKTIVGYTWFIGPFDRPSPLFFGDALAEIERFLWDEIDRQEGDEAELPFLVGVEQGAIMALAAAAAVPDLLSGVIAIDGFLPIVPGWDPPLAPLDGLPILQIDNASDDDSTAGVLAGPSLAATLRDWCGEVTRRRAPSGEIPGEVMSTWMRAQAPRHRAVRPAG